MCVSGTACLAEAHAKNCAWASGLGVREDFRNWMIADN
jgi:hypothetical protein